MSLSQWKSSILLCNHGEDDCPVCVFVNGGRDVAGMERVIQILDSALAESEEFTRSLQDLLIEKATRQADANQRN
jgi:hypothetical protein